MSVALNVKVRPFVFPALPYLSVLYFLGIVNAWTLLLPQPSFRASLPHSALEGKIGSFRFVHAADIHLDSPLKTLALRDSGLAAMIGNATRQAFVSLIDFCVNEQVDALLIAGDLYDGDQTSMKTARFLAQQFGRLHAAGIRAFVIRGNHDNLSRITRELTLPESVKVFSGRAEAIEAGRSHANRPVVIHGLSFANAQAPESLLNRYKPAVEGAINVGLLHTSLTGSARHNPYAPCSVRDLQATGFNYWALGHVHKRSAMPGRCTIVMPGIPQGRDINEDGVKSVSLVSITDDLAVNIEERVTGIAQFERVSVDASNIDDWRLLVRHSQKAIEQARSAASSENLVIRLRFVGSTSLKWRLHRDRDLMKTELDSIAAAAGRCWVETTEISCQDAAVPEPRNNPLSELRDLIASDVMGSDAFISEASAIVEQLCGQLPPECRNSFGSDENSLQETVKALAAEGVEDILGWLRSRAQAEAS